MDFQLSPKKLPPPKNITVSPIMTIGELLITWDRVRNPDEKLLSNGTSNDKIIKDVKYNIYRSNSIGGLFLKLNNYPLDKPRFEDRKLARHPNAQFFYKVRTVVVLNDGLTIVEGESSEPVMYKVTTTNKWFKKINERNMWILKNTGVLMDLYRRKVDGDRCPECWDSVREQGDPDCLTCFGTTYEGGYEPMMQIYVREKPASTSVEIASSGYTLNNSPGAWTITTIPLNNRDILFNPQGEILSITNSNINHAAGYLFHQELQTKKLDPTDKRYNLKRKALYPNV